MIFQVLIFLVSNLLTLKMKIFKITCRLQMQYDAVKTMKKSFYNRFSLTNR